MTENQKEILTAAIRRKMLIITNGKRERERERERERRKKREQTAGVLLTVSHTSFHWYSF